MSSNYKFPIRTSTGVATDTLVDFDDMFVPKELFLNSGLWSWGVINSTSSPVQVGSLTNWRQVGSMIIKISTNSYGAGDVLFAIKTDGSLWAWGTNISGQLGLGDTINRTSPVQVGTSYDWKQVICGFSGTAAIKTDGTLWVWGWNENGQLGLGDTTNRSSPVQVGSLTNWKQASISNRTIAIKTDGTLWTWGSQQSGPISSPVQVGSLTDWRQITNGLSASAAIKTDGTLWQSNAGVPYTMVDTSTNWKQVSFGLTHNLAIKTDGTLWAWNNNGFGELGLGDTINRTSPVQVGSLTNWKQIVGGTHGSAAIKTDGTLWTWGSSSGGRLGLGDTASRSSPVQVGSLTNWKQVTTGQIETLAIQAPDYNVDVPYAAWNTNNNLTTAMASTTINDIAANGNTFIAVGAAFISARSTDGGVTWSALPAISTAVGTTNVFSIAYGNNIWVALGFSGADNTNEAAYSVDDGVTWTNVNLLVGSLRGVRFVNNLFVCIGLAGRLSYSSNGSTWTAGPAGSGLNLYGVAYGNSIYCVVGESGELQYGSNIGSLTRIQYGLGDGDISARSTNLMTSVAFGNGRFIAVGYKTSTYSSVAYSSTDGITWTALSNFPSVSGTVFNPINFTITFDGAKFIVGGKAGFAYSSTNGTTWTNESTLTTAMTTGDINSIAVSSRRLIMAGGSAGKAARYAP